MERVNFKFIKGDTYARGFRIENFEMPIKEIYFTVKEKSSDKNFVLQKRLNNGIRPDAEVTNRFVLTIEADDTNDFKVEYEYVFDIQIVTDTMKKTIIGGYLTLEDWDITSKANEV